MAKSKNLQKQGKAASKKAGGPFLAAAVFCESILEEASGKMSAVGIVDGFGFYLSADAPANLPSKDQPIPMNQNALFIFRSGNAPGKHKLKLMLENPEGKRTIATEREIELSSPPHGGVNIKTVIGMQVYTQGVHWMDVMLDGRRVTRMPFMVTIQRLPLPANVEQSAAKGR